MKILIKKDEYLFTANGLHIIDEKGFAVKANEDVEIEIAEEYFEKVVALLEAEREIRAAQI